MARPALHADDTAILGSAYDGRIMQGEGRALRRRIAIDVTVDAAGVQEHSGGLGEEGLATLRPTGHTIKRGQRPELRFGNWWERQPGTLGVARPVAAAANHDCYGTKNETVDPAYGETHGGSFVSSFRKDKTGGEKNPGRRAAANF